MNAVNIIRGNLNYFIRSRIRPFIYQRLSRNMNQDRFDCLMRWIFAGRIKKDMSTIESNLGKYFFDAGDMAEYRKTIMQNFAAEADRIVAKADRILTHEFEILGSVCRLGDKINWHKDFCSGYEWDALYYKDLAYMHNSNNSDIKIPWELSRFHHFAVLGQAYWLSGDEKYADEMISQFLDWHTANPPRIGINWYFSMEVSIRLVNLITAYFLFCTSPRFTAEVKEIFFRTLQDHMIYIYCNLEYSYWLKSEGRHISGNHLIVDLSGFVIASLIFPGLLFKRWSANLLKIYYDEMKSQVNSDGVHYELSTSYHRLVTECFLAVTALSKKNGHDIPDFVPDLLDKMLDFVAMAGKPDGLSPQIRDEDNGRFLAFDERPAHDHGYLLNIGSILLDRAELKAVNSSFCAEAFWWMGVEGFKKYQRLKPAESTSRSGIFEESGFGVIREDDNYMFSVCAGIGMEGYSGHGHNDALSFELAAAGRSVLIDPGTYTYTGEPEGAMHFVRLLITIQSVLINKK